MTPFIVARAQPGRTDAVWALLADGLPGLSRPLAPPPSLWVAQPAGGPAPWLGAAALWPVPQRGGVWGFRAHCQVLPAHRRQGIGRALLAALAAEAGQWGAPRLISWDTLGDGPGSAFAQAVGGQAAFRLHHFLPDKATALRRCAALVERLHRQGRVPAGFALLPLHEVPREPLLALHCQEFHAVPQAATHLFEAHLADAHLRALSVALWDGQQLAGYLLAGPGGDLPEVSFWATAPGHRGGWAAAVMLHAFVARLGGPKARYHCNELNRAPMNFARRTAAPLEKITLGWCLEVPTHTPPTSTPAPSPARAPRAHERQVVLALSGLSLAQAPALCSQGRLRTCWAPGA
jgi:GNAT superfamily N-acetyltransferase